MYALANILNIFIKDKAVSNFRKT